MGPTTSRALERIIADVRIGLTYRPSEAERRAARWTMPYAMAALAIGLATGLLVPSMPSWWEVVVLPALLVLYPSLIEEVVFRGVLLPRRLRHASRTRQALAVTASTATFVAMHPLNHLLVGLSDTSAFTNPAFLVIVSLLGLTCAVQYLRSGTLWLPVATHWVTVVAWNLFLGRDLAL